MVTSGGKLNSKPSIVEASVHNILTFYIDGLRYDEKSIFTPIMIYRAEKHSRYQVVLMSAYSDLGRERDWQETNNKMK